MLFVNDAQHAIVSNADIYTVIFTKFIPNTAGVKKYIVLYMRISFLESDASVVFNEFKAGFYDSNHV